MSLHYWDEIYRRIESESGGNTIAPRFLSLACSQMGCRFVLKACDPSQWLHSVVLYIHPSTMIRFVGVKLL
jgi:hypothetical protein